MEKINIGYFDSIDELYEELLKYKEMGKSVFCVIKGHKIYSDDVNIDAIYSLIYGCSKEEYLKKEELLYGDLTSQLDSDRNHAKIMVADWIITGREHIYPENYKKWDDYVIDSACGPSLGSEIGPSLKIMKLLDDDLDIRDAVGYFKKQHYPKKESSLIRHALLDFSKRGPEFYSYSSANDLTIDEEIYLSKKRKENLLLASKHSNNKELLKHK